VHESLRGHQDIIISQRIEDLGLPNFQKQLYARRNDDR